jgi:hypothetical protein
VLRNRAVETRSVRGSPITRPSGERIHPRD